MITKRYFGLVPVVFADPTETWRSMISSFLIFFLNKIKKKFKNQLLKIPQ